MKKSNLQNTVLTNHSSNSNKLFIELIQVAASEKSSLRQLMQLYLYDFSEYDLEDVNKHGYYDYPYLDHYWTEAGRHPFFIKVDNQLAGFVLVRKLPAIQEAADVMAIAEFFVMRKYRRLGVGKIAALMVFDKFPGRWEVNQQGTNEPSKRFWENVIAEYSQTGYEILPVKEDDWEGQAIRFENG